MYRLLICTRYKHCARFVQSFRLEGRKTGGGFISGLTTYLRSVICHCVNVLDHKRPKLSKLENNEKLKTDEKVQN